MYTDYQSIYIKKKKAIALENTIKQMFLLGITQKTIQ